MLTWVNGSSQCLLGSSKEKIKSTLKDSSDIKRVLDRTAGKECGYLAYIFKDNTVITYQFENDSCCLYFIQQGVKNAPLINEIMDRNYVRIAPSAWFDPAKAIFWHLQIDTTSTFAFVYASYKYLNKSEHPTYSDKKIKSLIKLIN